jgi:hypothetical protein
MDQNFQTSFIPKKPIVRERAASSSQPVGFLFIIGIFILFTVLVATGGLYFYDGVLTKNVTDMQNSLNLAKNSFEPSQITRLQVLDKRLIAANQILSNHINVTPIFTALEQLTMKSVRYTKFSYTMGANGSNGAVDVQISGQAQGYRAIALQADLLGTNANLIDPVFSNLTLDSSGNVDFDLEFTVNSSFVNYKQTLLTQS